MLARCVRSPRRRRAGDQQLAIRLLPRATTMGRPSRLTSSFNSKPRNRIPQTRWPVMRSVMQSRPLAERQGDSLCPLADPPRLPQLAAFAKIGRIAARSNAAVSQSNSVDDARTKIGSNPFGVFLEYSLSDPRSEMCSPASRVTKFLKISKKRNNIAYYMLHFEFSRSRNADIDFITETIRACL